MSDDLFKEGGPLNVRKTGPHQFRFSIPLPSGENKRLGRECPDVSCSPRYFKVKMGTGITANQIRAYCPYCRRSDEPDAFTSAEQRRYAKEVLDGEIQDAVHGMIGKALGLDSRGQRNFGGGLISMQMSLKAPTRSAINPPVEEDVRRDVICPNCSLEQSVYGLAVWCADCGHDIFVLLVEAEYAIGRAMIGDVARRSNELGVNVAARDLENCLEDIVSIFEAVLKAIAQRHKANQGASHEEIDRFFTRIGNTFQSVQRANALFADDFGVALLDALSQTEVDQLQQIFEKRHPITHNLGIADKKYIKRAESGIFEGKHVSLSVAEVERAMALSLSVIHSLHSRLFESS